jgi:type I restriction enzyme R subunit
MSAIGQPERTTQNRVIALLREELGYDFLGDWTKRANCNIEECLRVFIQKQFNFLLRET